jgi:hypothetical protein
VINRWPGPRWSRHRQTCFENVTAKTRGRFKIEDGFLWNGHGNAAVRDRASLPHSCKKIEYVAAEEIRKAMLQVARDSFGATCTEIAHGACRLLGFGRVIDDVRVVIDQTFGAHCIGDLNRCAGNWNRALLRDLSSIGSLKSL